MSEREYVIKEVNGEFIIMCHETKTKGMLWWKKTVKELHRLDIEGYKVIYGHFSTRPLPSFDNLEEAQEQVRKFKSPVVYHEIE